jgi:preprotein translocase subunit SecA
LVEFKNEAYGLFESLVDRIDEELAHRIFRVGVARMPSPSGLETPPGWKPEIPLAQATTNIDTTDRTGLMDTVTAELGAEGGPPAFSGASNKLAKQTANRQIKKKVGRNDPCPCGATNPDGTPIKYKRHCYPKYG